MTGINLYENYYMAKANFRKHSLRIFKNNMCVCVCVCVYCVYFLPYNNFLFLFIF